MLKQEQNINGLEVIKNAIRSINGDIPSRYEKVDLVISANVNGDIIIDRKTVQIELHIRTNYGEVFIFWEDSGYKGYRAMGLYGAMRTDYQIFTNNKDNSFSIQDTEGKYLITVEY